MPRCQHCDGTKFEDGRAEDAIIVGKHRFVTMLAVKQCVRCHTPIVPSESVRGFERAVALRLAESGVSTGAAFCFMRKLLGLRAVDLAGLLDMTPEMISKYENDHAPIDRRALAVLGSLVEDSIAGSTKTRDRLVAMRELAKLAKATRIEIGPPEPRASVPGE